MSSSITGFPSRRLRCCNHPNHSCHYFCHHLFPSSFSIMVRCASTTLVSLLKLLGKRHNFATFSSRVFFRCLSKIPINVEPTGDEILHPGDSWGRKSSMRWWTRSGRSRRGRGSYLNISIIFCQYPQHFHVNMLPIDIITYISPETPKLICAWHAQGWSTKRREEKITQDLPLIATSTILTSRTTIYRSPLPS